MTRVPGKEGVEGKRGKAEREEGTEVPQEQAVMHSIHRCSSEVESYTSTKNEVRGEGAILRFVWYLKALSHLFVYPRHTLHLGKAERGEIRGSRGRYPDPSARPIPSEDYRDFKGDSPSLAEANVYGATRSTVDYYRKYLTQREWVHPDFYRLRESLEKRRTKAGEEKEKDQWRE